MSKEEIELLFLLIAWDMIFVVQLSKSLLIIGGVY